MCVVVIVYCFEGYVFNFDFVGGDENCYEFWVLGLVECLFNCCSFGSFSGMFVLLF